MASDSAGPAPANGYLREHARLLAGSFLRLTNRPLLAVDVGAPDYGLRLFEAPFAVLSHDTRADPLFNYANRAALELFELDWPALVATPSRLSAEPDERGARAALMARVASHGFIDDYAGVRISSRGRRFRIEQATVWNVIDGSGVLHGQAATFARWQPLTD